MKTYKLIFIAFIFLLGNTARSQVSVNINIGSPPQWGPVGYTEAQYYYLPDVEAYYDIQNSMFIYFGNGVWVHEAYLPSRYRNYDLYGGYKVVIEDYHGNAPYDHFNEHRKKYYKGYHGKPQKTIGDRPKQEHSGSQSSNGANTQKKQTQNNQNSAQSVPKAHGNKSNGSKGGKKK